MAKNINVCDDWNGNANDDFNFVNHSTTQVASVYAVEDDTWPFVQPSPITVPIKDGNGPGKAPCQLADLPDGTYEYQVDGCPTGGVPKNVTIP